MLDLTRLATLARFPETPLTLAEVVELAALATAAAGELQQWRARFEHDDPEGFDVYEDQWSGELSFVTRPTAEELAQRAQDQQERQWAVESRMRRPLWPPPPDPNEVIGRTMTGAPVTRGMIGEGSELMAMVNYARSRPANRVYLCGLGDLAAVSDHKP